MCEIFSLVKHKRKASEMLTQEIQKWISAYAKDIENIVSFGAVLVEKDGTIQTYHEALDPKSRLGLVGAIDALKEVIFRCDFDFY